MSCGLINGLQQDPDGSWWWRADHEPIEDHWALARLVPFTSHDIERLVKDAQDKLRELSEDKPRELIGDPSFSAYVIEIGQDVQERVRHQVNAIFESLQLFRPAFTYRVEPSESSLGSRGQRIRLADEVLRLRHGACIDLTLLFAACIRHAGLHPLIVITGDQRGPNHAVVGWWKGRPHFDRSAVLTQNDMSRCQDQIEVINATRIAPVPLLPFDEAIGEARTHLPWNTEGQKIYFGVDVEKALAANNSIPVVVPAMLGFEGIIDVTPELSLHLPTYEHRPKLEEDIRTWIESESRDRGYLLLKADAGGGKTALMSYLISTYPKAVFHIIKRGRGNWDQPEAICESLYRQILRQHRLNDEPESKLVRGCEKLHAVMTRLSPTLRSNEEKVVIFVDGLDECWGSANQSAARSLSDVFPSNLDHGFVFVLTSRRKPFLNELTRLDFCAEWPLEGTEYDLDTSEAIDRYIQRRLPELSDQSELRSLLLGRIKNNFLFAEKILNMLENQPITQETVETLPADLYQWMEYEYEFKLLKTLPEEKTKLTVSILGFLTVQRSAVGITRAELKAFVKGMVRNSDEIDLSLDVDKVVNSAMEFLKIETSPSRVKSRYRIYHEMFSEFLKERLGPEICKFCHKHIANVCMNWKDFEDNRHPLHNLFKYALLHLPQHLLECEEFNSVANIITGYDFVMDKASYFSIFDLLDDYNYILNDRHAQSIFPDRLEEIDTIFRILLRESYWIKEKQNHGVFYQSIYNSIPIENDSLLKKWLSFAPSCVWLEWINRLKTKMHLHLSLTTSHKKKISSIMYSLDGRLLASGSHDKTVIIWDVNTGRKKNILKHDYEIYTVAFSSDGRLISADKYITVTVWNVKTGRKIPYHGTYGEVLG